MSNLPDNVTHAALDRAYPGPITGYSISPEALIYAAVDGILLALLGDTDTMDGALDQAARDCVTGDDDDGEILKHVLMLIDYRGNPAAAASYLVGQVHMLDAEKRKQAARLEAAAAKAMREAGE